jgi:hypothetical protein
MLEAAALPDALLEHILRSLNPRELGRCRRVCHAWRRASSGNNLWAPLCSRDFPPRLIIGLWKALGRPGTPGMAASSSSCCAGEGDEEAQLQHGHWLQAYANFSVWPWPQVREIYVSGITLT